MFRRPSVRYGRTPEPETPYQKAAQAWDERIGAARLQARNWRLIAFGNLCLAASLAGGLIWLSSRGTVTPWVVEVDRLGQAQAVSPAIADYRPTDAQIAWHLAHFIDNVRSLPADPVIVRQNWLSAYDFITDKASRSTTMPAPAIRSARSGKSRSRSTSQASSAPPPTASASPGPSAATSTARSPPPSGGVPSSPSSSRPRQTRSG